METPKDTASLAGLARALTLDAFESDRRTGEAQIKAQQERKGVEAVIRSDLNHYLSGLDIPLSRMESVIKQFAGVAVRELCRPRSS